MPAAARPLTYPCVALTRRAAEDVVLARRILGSAVTRVSQTLRGLSAPPHGHPEGVVDLAVMWAEWYRTLERPNARVAEAVP